MAIAGVALDHWRSLRNRLMASPGFQRFAAAFPLTRPISRGRSRQLFDLLAGFTYTQVLCACVKLDLIGMLSDRPLGVTEIAARIGWPADRAASLLRAAVSLDILEGTSKGHYTLGRHGAALAGNPWIARFIEHHDHLYEDLANPLAVLRGESDRHALKQFWAYAGSQAPEAITQDAASSYTSLMAASQQAVADEILAAYDFRSCRHLLDAGGSNGSFIAAAAARHPHLQFTLFDLPAVTAIAREKLNAAGLASRVQIREGSFLSDPLPEGADVATLIRILHDHDDDSVLRLLTAMRRALPSGARLLVAEPLSGIAATAPVTDAYFTMYFAAMGQGRTRTAEEISAMARSVGFTGARTIRTRMPLITGLIEIHA